MKGKTTNGRVTVGDFSFPYTWVRGSVKNLNLRVTRDGTVRVSTPAWCTRERTERFLCDKVDMIRRALEKTNGETRYALLEGERIPIFGVLHTVCHRFAARPRVFCEEGCLILALPDPESEAARRRAFEAFAAQTVRETLTALTREYAPAFGVACPEVTVRRMRSRWGSCFFTKGRICYSTYLLYAPLPLLQLTVCHELAHFRHHDHSAAFYAWLSRVVPDHRERRAALRTVTRPQFIWD